MQAEQETRRTRGVHSDVLVGRGRLRAFGSGYALGYPTSFALRRIADMARLRFTASRAFASADAVRGKQDHASQAAPTKNLRDSAASSASQADNAPCLYGLGGMRSCLFWLGKP